MTLRSAFVLALFAAFALPAIAEAASVTIDGAPVSDVVAKDGHLMVPFRAPLESLGATVSWDDATNVASAALKGAQLVTVTIGSTQADVTGSTRTLSVAPVLEKHVAYIPVDALADISHATVAYSGDRQSAAVTGWDLAGVTAVGAGTSLIYVWVVILVIGGIIALIMAGIVKRMSAQPTW